ncbi:MAG: hypothetical protein EB043_04370, partial [Actinobacteria bacterium]|nr:hypothetical protein [Actinomycetota bacterium]
LDAADSAGFISTGASKHHTCPSSHRISLITGLGDCGKCERKYCRSTTCIGMDFLGCSPSSLTSHTRQFLIDGIAHISTFGCARHSLVHCEKWISKNAGATW